MPNKEFYQLSYDMLDFCARGGQIRRQQLGKIRRQHVDVRSVMTNLYDGYSIMISRQHFIIHVTTLKT